MSIAENLAGVNERVARAASKSGRGSDEITIIAVSKTFSAAHIREAFDAGLRHFGENRVQEWEGKSSAVSDLPATWHLIGHLQSNKVRRAVSLFHAIDSLDGLSLAHKLDRAVAEMARGSELQLRQKARTHGEGALAPEELRLHLPILIEVRLAPEATKSGIHPDELPALAEAVLKLPHLELRGLMTIPPLLNNPEDVRPYFRRLRELRDSLRSQLAACHSESAAADEESAFLSTLSMGMSHDFEVAIEEGATQVRLGTALFGERK